MESFRTTFRAPNCLILLVCSVYPSWGALQPEEVGIVANGSSRESTALARYYAKRRNIPAANICSLDLDGGAVLSRGEWERNVRPAIRKWLRSADRQTPIRCLVTTWDVPLKIGKADPAEVGITAQVTVLGAERARRLELAERLTIELNKIAVSQTLPSVPGEQSESAADSSPLEKARAEYETALAAAQQRVALLDDKSAMQVGTQKIQQLATAAFGLNSLGGALQRMVDSSSEARAAYEPQLMSLKGRMQGLNEARRMIEATPLTMEHHQMALAIIDQTNGVFDAMTWLDGRIKKLRGNETNSSLDNELACVMWPNYDLLLWQPNYLHRRFAGSPLRDVFPTMMVARIDAPSLPLCKAIVDTSIDVEQSGLQGKFYLDGRGLTKTDRNKVAVGSYADYDWAIKTTADEFQPRAGLELVYQNKPALFQPGECPDAALYCGWYSVAKYVDAFEWKPGSVAYHLASFELRSLHKSESEEWCKRMLEEGVCATIGAVQEPYLTAFPRPNEFFPTLLDGEATLVECFAATNPFNSWAMALIGDPLYRPFAN